METLVLATKLFIPPPRATSVTRAALVMRLQDGLQSGGKLTLICAPAGFGKTTLLTEWIAEVRRLDSEVGVAWLSLDGHDNDVSRFLAYLVAALRTAEPGIASSVASSLPLETALASLLDEIAELSRRVILVLDDFQLIERPEIRSALAFVLDHLPQNLHLVFASRSDPLFPLARLRSQLLVTELRAADLRFSTVEAADFLNRVMGLALGAHDIAALDSRTEGWIAGLQLAALSMRERTDVAGFIEAFTGSHRFVIDYLSEEVLHRQPDHVREFLLKTAFLDRFTGDLCQAVTGRSDSVDLLESLERDNLFVVPLDDQRQWYRYHHLFADVLRARSLRENRDGVPTLHRLASEWYEQSGLPEDAINHALSARDFERAAVLIERAIPNVRRSRDDSIFLNWLKLLPEDIARNMPVLSVYYAWVSLISGDHEQTERRLAEAEKALSIPNHGSAAGEELRMLPVSIAVYRATLAQARGDVAAAEEHARCALALTMPGDHVGMASAAGLLAMALWAKGDLTASIRVFGETQASLKLAGHTADLLTSTVVMADMLSAQGRPLQALQDYEQALRVAETVGDIAAMTIADLHVGLSEVLLDRGELAGAIEHLDAARPPHERASSSEHRHRWYVARARVREAEGDFDEALDLLGQAERSFVRGPLPEVRPIAGMKARIWIKQGRFVDVLAWINEQELDAADEVTYLGEFNYITLALLLIAQYKVSPKADQIHDATALLERLMKGAQAGGRTGSANEILLVQSSLLELQSPRPNTQKSVELLSDRELTVLRLLTTELSGPQIAKELFVSVSTIRTHTGHIFDKLSVNSRAAAVRRAREQGLL